MEFQKIKLHRSEKNRAAVTQITLDDDYNVPDYRQDIVKVIKERGELRFDEVKAMEGAAWIKGSLVFKVLYRSDKQEGKISCQYQIPVLIDVVQVFQVTCCRPS